MSGLPKVAPAATKTVQQFAPKVNGISGSAKRRSPEMEMALVPKREKQARLEIAPNAVLVLFRHLPDNSQISPVRECLLRVVRMWGLAVVDS
jgi:hypothetical protein